MRNAQKQIVTLKAPVTLFPAFNENHYTKRTFDIHFLFDWRPPMEEKKATPYGKVGIRPFNAKKLTQSQLMSDRIKPGRNKSHFPECFFACVFAPQTQGNNFIEGPNSNLTIRSGFFFFHRGLLFRHYNHMTPQAY